MSSVSDKSATYEESSMSLLAKSLEPKKLTKNCYDLEVTCKNKTYQVLEDITTDRRTDGRTDRTKTLSSRYSNREGGYIREVGVIKLNHIHELADVLKINQIPASAKLQLQSSFQLKLPSQIYFLFLIKLYLIKLQTNFKS